MPGNVLSGIINIEAPGVKQTTDKVADGINKVEKAAAQAIPKIDGVAKAGESMTKVFVQMPASLQNVSTNTDKVVIAAARLNDQLKKSRPATNQATTSLLNLGRVAQDAPFGIIGIANNINPLVESLQRLVRESGGGVNAIKALAAAFLGGGGLGFLISAATSALTFFAIGSRKSKDETEKLTKAAQEAERAEREMEQAFQAASSAVVQQAGNLSDLKQLLVSTTTETRTLSQETIKLAVTQFLFTQKRELLEAAIAKQVEGQIKLTKGSVALTKEWVTQLKAAQGATPIRPATDEDINKAKQMRGELTGFQQQMVDINKIANALGISFGDIFKKTFEKDKKGPDLDLFVGLTRIKPQRIEVLPPVSPGVTQQNLTSLFKGFVVPVAIKPILDFNFEQLKTELNKLFSSGIANLTGGLGEAIGNAVTGNLENIGASIIQTLGGLLQEIGKALIKYGIIKKGLDQILGPGGIAIPGGVAIGLGVAAIAFGQIFKNFAGARAMGGPVQGGKSYLVGERGAEVFTPNTGGQITSNSALGAVMSGGAGEGGVIMLKLSGNDLIAAISLNQLRQGRLS